MAQIQLIRKGILPIAKMKIEIGGHVYMLAGLKAQQITLPEGTSEVKMRLEGWYATNTIHINAQSTKLIIRPFIPDWYYLLCLLCCFLFFQFEDTGWLIKYVVGGAGGLMILSIMYFTFFRDQKYFSCTVR
ncbi:hypothetical protein [Arachidicoccus terrestris]|uniref:hypothetical protein n=1 Tax=Arachidicoccus terrestris TaxID=2875539 RepID=UPI001CC35883|nr:hypothetical protein [Arachidicoccus terrestris]UAY56500.1 hypothetical protein K9M52_05705 [Arachidicoccus terrestris]